MSTSSIGVTEGRWKGIARRHLPSKTSVGIGVFAITTDQINCNLVYQSGVFTSILLNKAINSRVTDDKKKSYFFK